MHFETSYPQTSELLRKAFRYYFWQRAFGYSIAMFLVCGISLWSLFSGERTGVAGFSLGLCVCYFYMWWHSAKQVTKLPKSAEGTEVKLVVEDICLRFETVHRTTTLKWTGIPSIAKFQDLWILNFDNSGHYYAPIPLNALSEEARAFIEKNVAASGGTIRTQ